MFRIPSADVVLFAHPHALTRSHSPNIFGLTPLDFPNSKLTVVES
jgi:hypothetical protein